MTIQTFDRGARGYLIGELQHALQVAIGRPLKGGVDDRYGDDTMRGVIEWANAQADPAVKAEMQRQCALFGQAGPLVWQSLGLQWPDVFARCLQLTAAFEGTGFFGSCGPKETGDTAGVTYGIIGFTSYNGELQELLREYQEREPDMFARLGKSLGKEGYESLCRFIQAGADNIYFETWGLTATGSVIPALKIFLQGLGETQTMKRLQMEWASERYGKRAWAQVKALFGNSATERPYALLYDISVQNGGLKDQEIADLQSEFKSPLMTETDKLHAINTKLIERLRNARRSTAIIEDVRARKGAIATGSGRVHGSDIALRRFAL